MLAAYFVERMASHLNKEVACLTPEALALLKAYGWPGNVRELKHVVQRAVIVCQGPVIRAEDIALDFARAGDGRPEEIVTLEELERRYSGIYEECWRRPGGSSRDPAARRRFWA